MLRSRTIRAEIYSFDGEKDSYEQLRYHAASKLVIYKGHRAGKGSYYIYIGDIKIRFSDHQETSEQYNEPDYNIVNRKLKQEEIEEIRTRLSYPEYCKQRAFSLHVNTTIPKLKKILSANCYEDRVENHNYPNTTTKFIVVEQALKELRELGISDRIPIRQEMYSNEDYSGGYY